MAAVDQSEYDADYERRKAEGQVGWYQPSRRGTANNPWPLTRYNSKSFDDNDGVVPVYECDHCTGTGFMFEPTRKGA